MFKNKIQTWLFVIFLATIVIRLFLAFHIPNFTYESYFHLRHVEHIAETGLPLYEDDLSYGGRELIFLPFFHYFMAFFDLFLPLEFIAKVLPNLLIASLVLIVFMISNQITHNQKASLLSALVAGLLPILYNTNSFTPETLFLPLIFLCIYAFLRIKERRYVHIYIAAFLFLSLTSTATFLLLVGFCIYLLLSVLESKRTSRAEIELILFSIFFFIWTQFLFFKNVLLEQGIQFIWQNIPSQIIMQYFPAPSVGEALLLVSIVPFLAGIFVVYRSLFQLKSQKSFLLISLAISTTLLTWFRLIQFELSLTFFGMILAVLFASFYKELNGFIRKTKISHLHKLFSIGLLVVLLPSMIYPAIVTAYEQEVPSRNEVLAFKWIAKNTPSKAGVLASLEEGHLIGYFGRRKSIIDDQFSLVGDVEERFDALNSLYVTSFQTQALGLLDEYGIQYIIISPRTRNKYGINQPKYFTGDCFDEIYEQNVEDDTKIFYVKCTISKTE